MSEPDTCVAAIDPGIEGAVAFLFPAVPDRVSVEDMPTVEGAVDVTELQRLLRQYGPVAVAVERVGPMPRDGSKQAFGFGAAYSAAKATVQLSGYPLHLFAPQTWKRHHRILGAEDPKEAARGLALRLFPGSTEAFRLKRHHGRADAALLAAYAASVLSGA